MSEKRDWRLFALLLGAGLLGVLAILPFVAELIESRAFGPPPDLPIPVIVGLALLQNGLLLGAAVFVGLAAAKRTGLETPLFRAWAAGRAPQGVRRVVVPGVVAGAVTGAVLVGLEAALFLRDLPVTMLPLFDIPLWKRLLSGVLYGGLTEELFMRLFLVSSLAWLLGRVFSTPEGRPRPGAFRAAIVLAAVVFGLGHLPVTSALAPLTPALVARALLLNGVAGVVFGYLYWRRGLEAAMLGHMSAHLVLQVPGVMLLKALLQAPPS